MEVNEAQDRMREVQRIMETATLFTLLPSTAAAVGGLLALAGCLGSYWLLNSFDFADMLRLSLPGRAALCGMWFAVAFLAVGVNAVLTVRMAARQRIAIHPRPAQAAMFSLTPCIAVATILSLQFLFSGEPREVRYIAPVWMLLYGTGVYTAGLFSVRPPRVLGLGFILAGGVALFAFPEYGVISTGISFGLLHLLFGAYVFAKQRHVEAP